MPRQCQFPVQFSDNRRCYRTGTTPGFTLTLTLIAVLSGYAGLNQAAPLDTPAVTRTSSATSSSSRSVDFKLPSGLKASPACGTLN